MLGSAPGSGARDRAGTSTPRAPPQASLRCRGLPRVRGAVREVFECTIPSGWENHWKISSLMYAKLYGISY